MGGALAMLAEGLLDRFPSDELYGLHNAPGAPVGHFAITPGTALAGGAFFDITVTLARRCKPSSPATCRRPRRQYSA